MVELLEREGEILALRSAVGDAATGEGRIVTVVAAGGLGKTRLLAAARELARDAGLRLLAARGSELGSGQPASLVRELVAGAAAAAPLLERGDNPAEGEDLLLGLYWLLANLAEETPLALLVDDAHLADPRSVDALSFLAGRLDELAVLLVVAARPARDGATADPVARIEAEAEPVRLRPAALSREAVGQVVGAELGARPQPAFARACHEATGGNPFYAHELARELRARGIAPFAKSAPAVAELGPDGVSRALLSRLGAGDGATVARALAILGDGTEVRVLAAVAGLGVAAASAAIAGLTRAGVLADERPARFLHPIVRASLLSELAEVQRADAHALAAGVLHEEGADPATVAAHLLDAEPGGAGPWAAEALREAAALARSRGAPALAARLLRRALSEPHAPRALLLRELGTAAFEAGDADALNALADALAAAPGPSERARVALATAIPMLSAGHVGDAVHLIEDVRAVLGDEHAELALELDAQLSSLALLDPPSTERVMTGLAPRADITPQSAAGRRLLANLAQWAAMTGAPAERSAALARRALGGGRLLADDGPASPAVLFPIFLLIAAEQFDDATAELDAALAAAQQRGSVVGFVATSMLRSLLAYRLGDLVAAEAEARAADDTARLHGWDAGLPATTGFLVDALIERGEVDEAGRVFAGSGWTDDIPDHLLAHAYLVARGRQRIAAGDRDGGLADLLELGRRDAHEGFSATIGAPTWRTYAAPVLAASGRREEAVGLAEEELAIARAWDAPRAIGCALRVAGVVAVSDEESIATLQEAVAMLATTPARLEHARALGDLGSALRRSGKASAARPPLRAAADLAARCGARPLADHALDELQATGLRRRQPTMLSGPDSLTPSERRIAAMAARGLTNTQIAQALFLTRKTIEMHLGNAYRKLGIGSRTELPDALGAEAGAGSS